VKTIPLTRGLVAVVDDEDYEALASHNWLTVRGRRTMYAARHQPRAEGHRMIFMHRVLLGLPVGAPFDGDHINGDGLDNRRHNLRVATRLENLRNSGKRGGTTSQFKGVCLFRRTGRWQAYIRTDDRRLHLGYFATEREAAEAYDIAARLHFGSFARPNFEVVR
jgi:hypothetical protein